MPNLFTQLPVYFHSNKKKFLLCVSVISIFVVSVGGTLLSFYVHKSNAKTVATSSTPAAPQVSEAPSDGTALLVREDGEVQYKLPDQTEFKTVTESSVQITPGTTVRTKKKSLAHVIFANNSMMSLSHDTEVVVNFENNNIKISQLLGNAWYRVQKVLQGDGFSVQTPTTLATVRGTEFGVNVLANKRSKVHVVESVVEVSRVVKKEDGQVKLEDTHKVQKNQEIVVSEKKTEPLQVVPIPEEEKQTTWFQRNLEITDEISQAQTDVMTSPTLSADPAEPESTGIVDTDTPKLTPALDMDTIRWEAIKAVINNIDQNEDLQKIDEDTSLLKNEPVEQTPTQSTDSTGDTPQTQEQSSSTKTDTENGVGGITLEDILPIPTSELPTTAPAFTEEPTAEPAHPTETERELESASTPSDTETPQQNSDQGSSAQSISNPEPISGDQSTVSEEPLTTPEDTPQE